MEVISVNVGLPRQVHWKGKVITTAIFKEPVAGAVRVGALNLDGDRQADPSVHGGPTKAVYAYPAEHYDFWRRELPETNMAWGAFGENLTTRGLSEEAVHIGDRFRVGITELVVTEPRMPCYKLRIRFGRDDILKRFLDSGRTGFYFGVSREGEVQAGDPIVPLEEDPGRLRVADVTRLYTSDKDNRDLLRRAARLPSLPEGWRSYFQHQLDKRGVRH